MNNSITDVFTCVYGAILKWSDNLKYKLTYVIILISYKRLWKQFLSAGKVTHVQCLKI